MKTMCNAKVSRTHACRQTIKDLVNRIPVLVIGLNLAWAKWYIISKAWHVLLALNICSRSDPRAPVYKDNGHIQGRNFMEAMNAMALSLAFMPQLI